MNSSIDFVGMQGLTWRRLMAEWSNAIQRMAGWPIVRWLTPVVPVCLVTEDGRTVVCLEENGVGAEASELQAKRKFVGVVLPDELVLWRTLKFPNLEVNELENALTLDVAGASPFSPDDLRWAHTPPLREDSTGINTTVCLISRKLVGLHLAKHQAGDAPAETLEVWVRPPSESYLLLVPGFGENFRQSFARKGRHISFGLVFLFLTICFAAAVTPTLQLRMRALQAVQSYEQLQVRVAPALKYREQIVALDARFGQIKTQIDQSIQPESVLLALTQYLPDETYLTNLQIQGDKITLVGLTPNAASLMQQLSAQAGVKDVRAPIAAIKARGMDRENFNIELTLESAQGSGKP